MRVRVRVRVRVSRRHLGRDAARMQDVRQPAKLVGQQTCRRG